MRRLRVALLVSLVGLAACSRPAAVDLSTAAPQGSTSAAAPLAAAPVAVETELRGWQQGQEYEYRFQTDSRIALGDKTLLYDFHLTGRARVLALEVSPNAASFYVELEDAKFVSRIPGSQAEFDRLTSQLAEPYFFEMKGGLVSSASAPKDLHPLAMAVFRSLSAALQFAAVEGQPRVFTTKEFDTTGQYEAKYTPSSDPLVWQKQKQKYLGILLGEHESKEAREIAPKVVQSEAEIRLSPEGRPVRISMRDEMELANSQAPLQQRRSCRWSPSRRVPRR